ncbi:MAG: VOC family protein [bacterium]|nr:VOC family protein [bacterium]
MSVKLNSYINFNGNAKEAVEFYKLVFGGEVVMDTFRSFVESTPDSGMPVEEADLDKVMHAALTGENGIELMFSDVPTGMSVIQPGGQITLTLNGDDEATLRGYWDKLAEGGQIMIPLEKSPWSDLFGALTDKFGISWMLNISPKQA